VEEADIERVLESVNRAREQVGRAVVDARNLPETPHWRGSSHILATSQQENLVLELQALHQEFGELSYRCHQDLQRLRRHRDQEGLAGGAW
jgi:hypothetical protein